MVDGAQRQVRRREIEPRDLADVADLLRRGFPARSRAYWERGLRRMGERPAVASCPRYGFLLQAGGRPVGVALMLFSAVPQAGGTAVRCNLSSWFVEPEYRMQAPLLVSSLLKRPDITFTNISPAPHTWATIEAQGFRTYAEGQVLVVPALGRGGTPARVSADPEGWRGLPEATLLDDHRGYGCTCLAVEAEDGTHPFVFLPFRARSGRLPLPFMQLVYTRDVADFARLARPIGLWLLPRGYPGVVMDGEGTPGGPPVLRRSRRGRRYAKGPDTPRPGDLAYTERVTFGA